MRTFLLLLRVTVGMTRLGYRFLTGHPLSGQRKTDATFWRPARHSLDPSGTALRWEMMRGAARLAWRLGGLYVLGLSSALLLLLGASSFVTLPWWMTPSVILWVHAVGGGTLLAGWAGRTYVKEYGYSIPSVGREESRLRLEWRRVEGRREWRREKVLPVSRSAALILGTHIPDRRAEDWVVIPRSYRESSGGPVEIRLPSSFTAADEGVKKRLISSVGHKLGMKSVVAQWQTEGSSPRVLLSVPPSPPTMVRMSDVEEFLRSTEEYRPFLGMSGDGVPLLAEMIDDSPHIALSAGPGAGKSTLAKLIIMQVLHWGWGVVVLDWKQTAAYSWLGGLSGVTYLTKIDQIHDMGVRIAEEIDLRKENGMAGRAKILVVRDEWNVTADLLMAYYQDLRSMAEPEDKKMMPVRSPALRGYAVLDFAGREYGVHDLCIAQRFSARIFNGNADIRECFQIKLMARYSPQTVKMLAPDIKPFPKKNNTPGRWAAVIGDEVSVIQVPLIENDEARAYALAGRQGPLFAFSSTVGSSGGQPSDMVHDQGNPLPLGVARGSGRVDARKLSEMVDALTPLNITLKILQHAAGGGDKGDPTFPSPFGGSPNKGYTYDFGAVQEWAKKRHAAQQTQQQIRG